MLVITTATPTSKIRQALGLAKTGASSRAPKPRPANQPMLAIAAPRANSQGVAYVAETEPSSTTVSR